MLPINLPDEEINILMSEIGKYLPIRRRLLTISYYHHELNLLPVSDFEKKDNALKCKILALTEAMIIGYASCYSKNNSDNQFLRESKVFKNKFKLKEIHKDIIEKRNKLFAHNEFITDNIYCEVINSILYVKANYTIHNLNQDGLDAMMSLISTSSEYISELLNKLFEEFKNKTGLEIHFED